MKYFILVITMVALFSLQACSSQLLHSMFQAKQQNDCQTIPNSQYAECMEQANEIYDEYSNKRKEIIGSKS
jgi:hypothetical protein